ncbi:MAG: 30S ribosomal protein S18 [Anaerolineales bacterium]|nr:30S ribosomal protein S18 [Anaerolineales bacterium]
MSNYRRSFRRRNVNLKNCSDKVEFDYKRPETLRSYITSHGRIKPQRLNGLCAKHQRRLAKEIKKARHLALLPFVTD